MKVKTLNDVFPNAFEGEGLFSVMNNPPWGNTYDATDLDIQFFSEHGKKPIAPIIEHYLDEDDEDDSLTVSERTKLADIVLKRFKTNWEHKFAILGLEYNPIENYNSIEQENITDNKSESTQGSKSNSSQGSRTSNTTDNETIDIDDTDTATKTNTGTVSTQGQDTNTPNLTQTSTNANTNTNALFGFNSSVEVNSDKQSGSANGTVTNTGTDTTNSQATRTDNLTENNNVSHNKSGTDNRDIDVTESETASGSETTTGSLTGTGTTQRRLTRAGNIGVTTSQQMIQSEIELWNWNFISDVFSDVCNILTLPIYI